MYEAFEKDLFTVCMPIIFCVFESSPVNIHVYKRFQPLPKTCQYSISKCARRITLSLSSIFVSARKRLLLLSASKYHIYILLFCRDSNAKIYKNIHFDQFRLQIRILMNFRCSKFLMLKKFKISFLTNFCMETFHTFSEFQAFKILHTWLVHTWDSVKTHPNSRASHNISRALSYSNNPTIFCRTFSNRYLPGKLSALNIAVVLASRENRWCKGGCLL